MKKISIDKAIENVFPDNFATSVKNRDTLKSLIAYKLVESEAFVYASDWYYKSYASFLYPHANLDSPRISEFLAELGTEEFYGRFFKSYLEIVIKNGDSSNQRRLFPLCIDSEGLGNDIKTFLTAVNNHGGLISNELRVTYVVDRKTKLPLFLRISVGNIIDNSLLINTVNMLKDFGIEVELVIMDAGYSSLHNISQLVSANIPFLTRMPQNRKEYKKLIEEHGVDLKRAKYLIKYGNRSLFVKAVPIVIDGNKLFEYVIHDQNRALQDEKNATEKIPNDPEHEKQIDDALVNSGKFILLSSNNIPKDEIVELYYSRQTIEQIFDINKNYVGGLPLRCHTEETIRGFILLTFMATAVYSSMSQMLSNSKFSAHGAITKMKRLRVTVLEHSTLLEELTKDQKNIFVDLNLGNPFVVENGNILHNNHSFLNSLDSRRRRRGRPKGSVNKVKSNLVNGDFASSEWVGKRGRPRGSKNKQKTKSPNVQSAIDSPSSASEPTTEGQRKRGRPLGSKNKPKAIPSAHDANGGRRRGRPKGSKNKLKGSPLNVLAT
jgi:hypothetical protein